MFGDIGVGGGRGSGGLTLFGTGDDEVTGQSGLLGGFVVDEVDLGGEGD